VTATKTKKAAKRSTICKACGFLRGGPDNHKCNCDWSAMTAAERKAERKREHAESAQRRVELKRIDLRLDLSPSNAQELLSSLKPWLKEFRSGAMQMRLSARAAQSIYIIVGPQQFKKFVARLAEVAR
jgi:hypothetical protein